MTDLTCGIVQDLLPSVADGIAGEETQAAVARHMKTCEACRDRLAAMTAGPAPAAAPEEPAFDFLKTAKKKHRRALIAAVLIVCLLSAAAGGTFYRLRTFVWGRAVPVSELDYQVETQRSGEYETGEPRTVLSVMGTPRDSSMGVSRTERVFSDGTLALTVELARASDRNPGSFLFSKELTDGGNAGTERSAYPGEKGELTRVTLNGETIWEDGVVISEQTRRLFAAAHPYMGAMPENAESAQALGLYALLGGYENELQTSKTPYVWTMRALAPLPDTHEAGYYRARLATCAAGLLATIGNLDAVEFVYRIGEGEETTFLVSEQTADAWFGSSVKEAGRTLPGLQTLLDELRFTIKVQH